MLLKKNILSFLIFSLLITNFSGLDFFSEKIFASDYVEGEEKLLNCKPQNYLITAYYSPIPGQKFYMRGDYNSDIRLNGNGTNGADGTEVYMGMLAGPSGYDFGTKVVLPGLGIGTIHDRGGAIYSHSDYIRIDIWMGKGEVGLSRALNWGIQFIDGKICDKSPELDNLSFLSVNSKLPSYVEKRLIDRTEKLKNGGTYTFKGSGNGGKNVTIGGSGNSASNSAKFSKKEVFEFVNIPQDVGFGDEGKNVLKLQIVLKNLGFYRENPNGVYDNATMESVFNFQRENGVVESLDNLGAGHFGKNTRKALEEFLNKMSEKFKKINYSVESEVFLGNDNTEISNSENNLKKINPEYKKNLTDFQANILQAKNFKPVSKEDIFSFGENFSVKEIQEILKKGGSLDEFGELYENKNFEKNSGENISDNSEDKFLDIS